MLTTTLKVGALGKGRPKVNRNEGIDLMAGLSLRTTYLFDGVHSYYDSFE